MSNRDRQHEHRRQGRGTQDEGTSQPPVNVDDENAHATPVRLPSQAPEHHSVVPTPNYDPRFNFPYFDQIQAPPKMFDVNIPPTNVGDISGMTPTNPAFWQTFGQYMPYNHNLMLSLFENMQQNTLQRLP